MDAHTLSLLSELLASPGNLVGFILPPFVDFLNKDIPEDREIERTLVVFGLCLIVAALANLNSIVVNSWAGFITTFALVFTQSQAVYKLYFKNSFLRNKWLEILYQDVEEAITPSTPSTPQATDTNAVG